MRSRLLFFLVVPALLFGQESSPLSAVRQALTQAGILEVEETGKCGTPLIFEARRRMNEIPVSIQSSIRAALQRPVMQTNRLSPSGRFRIHYDTTEVHQPAVLSGTPAVRVANSHEEYVDSVAAVFDHCWNVEIDMLGFEAPPLDGDAGGGPEHDVYIRSLFAGEFGYISDFGEIKYESGDKERTAAFIVIDNDFLGLRTEGWDGLRVTAAHEFFHVVQVGSYGIWNIVPNYDFYFYELTGVWMEDVVYDDINDYYEDLPLFFSGFKDAANRSYSFAEFNARRGYERSIFAHFLDQRFGRELLVEVWDGVKTRPVLRSIHLALQDRASSLADAFSEFAHWNLFTASRADSTRYYREGTYYPKMSMNFSAEFTGSASVIRSSAFPFSLQYFGYRFPSDTVIAIVVEKNFEGAYSSPGIATNFEITLSNSKPPGGVQTLRNGVKSGFAVEKPENWRTQFISSTTLRDLREASQPFPSPLRLFHADALVLPADGSSAGVGEVFLLSSSLDLVFSGSFPVVDVLGKSFVRIPVSELRKTVGTGVHFVVLKTREKEYQWKLAVIR